MILGGHFPVPEARADKCPTCGGAVDDPGYDEINAGDQTGRDYCPDPFHDEPASTDPVDRGIGSSSSARVEVDMRDLTEIEHLLVAARRQTEDYRDGRASYTGLQLGLGDLLTRTRAIIDAASPSPTDTPSEARLREALKEISLFPCQYPDDPEGDAKMAVNSVNQSEIAAAALDGRELRWDCDPAPYENPRTALSDTERNHDD